MSNFEKKIQQIVENQQLAEAQEILYELSTLYEQFHCLSRRIIYLLTGEEKSRTGLTDFVKSVFARRGAICQKEVLREVVENFDCTVTSKAVSDSLHYLMKVGYLDKFWSNELSKYKYTILKDGMPKGKQI
jgi:hypothetical protein